MPGKTTPHWDAFLSHSSEDDDLATRLGDRLGAAGVQVWVDHRNLRRRGLLLDALQEAMLACANVILIWSESAAGKRYVKAEWNFAWNREIPILPCCVDATPLPMGLAGELWCDFRGSFETGYTQLEGAIKGPPPMQETTTRRSETALPASPERDQAYRLLYDGQAALIGALTRGDVGRAAQLQQAMDPIAVKVEAAFPEDADILDLAGYHLKNAYQIKHWDEIQARRHPADELLAQAEERFWRALAIVPNDPGALNGMGSILSLRGDLDAAEFYVLRAIERCREEGIPYPDAEDDLATIHREKRLRRRRDAGPR